MTTSVSISWRYGLSLPFGPSNPDGWGAPYQMLTLTPPSAVIDAPVQGFALNATGLAGANMNSPFQASSGMINGEAGPPAAINPNAVAWWASTPRGQDFTRAVVTLMN